MRRRSRAGGETVKARRPKMAALKRRNAPKAVRHSSSSASDKETKVVRFTRELTTQRTALRRLRGSQSHQLVAGRVETGFRYNSGERNSHLRRKVRHAVSSSTATLHSATVAMHNAPPAFARIHKGGAGRFNLHRAATSLCYADKAGEAYRRRPPLKLSSASARQLRSAAHDLPLPCPFQGRGARGRYYYLPSGGPAVHR